MKHLKLALLLLLIFPACGKKFSDVLLKAETSFTEKNYIDTIDTLTNGMGRWKESDGADTKAHAFELLGKSYHQLRNFDKAMESYEQAVQLSDKSYESALALGNLRLTKSQPDQALKSFRDALRMKPDDPLALLGLGNSHYAQKQNQEAITYFERVLDVSPGVRDAQESLAILKSKRHAPQPRRVSQKKPLSIKKTAPAKKPAQRKKR